jgi:hypothetical protein
MVPYRFAIRPYPKPVRSCQKIFMKYFLIILVFTGSQDSSVGIATGWTARVQFPVWQDFSLPHSVQTDSGAHSASYPMDIGG